MPIIKSAVKRMHQTAKRRARNVATKRDVKTAVKAFFAKPTAKSLSAAQSEIDTAVKKGLLKKNTAARRKASLAKVAKESGVKLATGTKKPAAKTTAAKPATAKKASATAKAKADKPAKKATATKTTTAKKPAAKKTTK